MNIDVFISYHTQSSLPTVEAIVNKLESIGIRCWYANRDSGGAYARAISDAINTSRIFLLILNKDASESPQVLNELNMVTERLAKNEPVEVMPFHIADEDISPDARYYVGRMHWIDAMTPPLYERINELTVRIAGVLGREATVRNDGAVSDPSVGGNQYRLISKEPFVRNVFLGREELLDDINRLFKEGNRVVFLEGIGGIGKSELAKQYARSHKNEYDNIIFMTYSGSLEDTVCDLSNIEIEGLQRGNEDTKAFFERKMKVIRSIADEKTLFIVDNFDVDNDERMEDFLEGRHRVIFTTRNRHNIGKTIRVSAIDSEDVLLNIFEENYDDANYDMEAERPYLLKLFERVENHTYMIELIAKQMKASYLSAEEMLRYMRDGSIKTALPETVPGRKDQKTAFGHMCSVFNLNSISDEDAAILRYLSIMGPKGVPAARFRDWAELKSFEGINALVRKSWVRSEGRKFSLHPLVSDVVRELLQPTVENCGAFLNKVADYLFIAWFRPIKENMEIADSVVSLAEYFSPFEGKLIEVWSTLPSFMWQVNRFGASVQFARVMYDTCLAAYGEASMITGYIAKMVGGCYFNSGRLKESIPWYKRGLECMLLSGEPENEDLAMSYEKVARCYTWEYEQDFEKAQEYFNKALEIRERIKSKMEMGIPCSMFESREIYDENLANDRISETYFEMGRMYQKMDKYDIALEYTKKAEDLDQVVTFKFNNISTSAYREYDKGVSLYHIGLQKLKTGNDGDACKYLQQALELLKSSMAKNEKMRGDLAIDSIQNREYLADTYAALGQYGNAANEYMAALNSMEIVFGADSENVNRIKDKMNFNR